MKLTIVKSRGLGMTDPLDQEAVRYIVSVECADIAGLDPMNLAAIRGAENADCHPIVNELWALVRIAMELDKAGMLPPADPAFASREW